MVSTISTGETVTFQWDDELSREEKREQRFSGEKALFQSIDTEKEYNNYAYTWIMS